MVSGWMKAPLLDEAQLGGRRTPTNGFAMYNSAAFAFQRQGPPPSFHPDYTPPPPPPSSGKCTHFTILVSVDAAVVVLLLMYTCSDLCQVRLDLLRSQSLSPSRRLLLFAR